MRSYTAHLRPGAVPLLIPEGFSWGAFFFGGLWLLAHRSWIPGIIALAAGVLLGVLTAPPVGVVLELGLAVLLGLTGQDLRRWSLALRGYMPAHVVVARNTEGAVARLLSLRPDLAPRFVPAGELP